MLDKNRFSWRFLWRAGLTFFLVGLFWLGGTVLSSVRKTATDLRTFALTDDNAHWATPHTLVFESVELEGAQAFSVQYDSADSEDVELMYQLYSDAAQPEWLAIGHDHEDHRPDDVDLIEGQSNYQLQFVPEGSSIRLRLEWPEGANYPSLGVVSLTLYPDTVPHARKAEAAVAPSSIISRDEWNPNNSACPLDLVGWPLRYYQIDKIVIHHTADDRQNSINSYDSAKSAVQAICNGHVKGRGWGDVGYNYLIAPTGHIFEGRAGGEGVEAGHTYGANKGTVGIALIGTYSDNTISAAARESLVKLLADLSQRYQIDPTGSGEPLQEGCYSFSTPNIGGHREYQVVPLKNVDCTQCSWADYNSQKQSSVLGCPNLNSNASVVVSNATQCPGNAFFPTLASVRQAVAAQSPSRPATGVFLAEFFNNKTLSGTPIRQTTTGSNGAFDLDWGNGAPHSSVNADNFSARFRGVINAPADGMYTFNVGGDDGVRLYVDNELVVDQWKNQGYIVYTAHVGLTQGPHQIRLEYYEAGGAARTSLSWAKRTLPNNHFLAKWYGNGTFDGPPLIREYDGVDFDWGTGSPDDKISGDFFTGTIEGTISLARTDNYVFDLEVDDRVRLYVDDMNTPLINEWQDQARSFSAIKPLAKGTHKIKLVFRESTVASKLKLNWSAAPGATFSSSSGKVRISEHGGSALTTVNKGTTIKITHSSVTGRSYLSAGDKLYNSTKGFLLTPLEGAPPTITYESFGRSPHNAYKTFRGEMLILANSALQVINRVGVEDYLKGLGETGLNSDLEYTKALIMSARTYALYHYQNGGKNKSSGYTINNTASDQVYYGYAYEQKGGSNSVLTQAVNATKGKVITHSGSSQDNDLIVATYFSQTGATGRTCGQTRDSRCTWNVGSWPWIPDNGVADPWWMKNNACYNQDNNGRTGAGHGYGLSGRGAYCFATQDNRSADWILNYYYDGIQLKNYPTDTANLKLLIGLESLPFSNLQGVPYDNGSLLRATGDSAVYLLSGGEKRPFVSAEIFLSHGYKWTDIQEVAPDILNAYPTGLPVPYKGNLRPNGTLIKTSNSPAIYLVEDNLRRPIPSAEVFLSYGYDWSAVKSISTAEMARYATGEVLTYQFTPLADGSILVGSAGTVYLIDGGKKRPFPSADAFFLKGYYWNQVKTVTELHLQGYPTGAAVSAAWEAMRDGTLVVSERGGAVYLLDDAKLRLVPSASVFLNQGYKWSQIKTVGQTYLSKGPKGSPVLFKDNTLATGSSAVVYKLSGGNKSPFPSADVFLASGYAWGQIIQAEDGVLKLYKTIAPVEYTFTARADGTLVKAPDDPAVYMIDKGKKRAIPRAEVFLSHGFKWGAIKDITNLELSKYPIGELYPFKNNTLVKTEVSPTIWLIQGTTRRAIPSAEVFLAQGFKWGNILSTDRDYLFSNYPEGQVVGAPQEDTPPEDPPQVPDATPSL